MAPPVEWVKCKPKYIPDQHPECETDPAIRRENFYGNPPIFYMFCSKTNRQIEVKHNRFDRGNKLHIDSADGVVFFKILIPITCSQLK